MSNLSASVELIDLTPDAEKRILFIARASSDQTNEDVGLIRYLIKNDHWSPFEMAHATFEINTSRTIAHQILRHRSFSFQEFSQRYAAASGGTVKYRARMGGATNRQSSIDDAPLAVQAWFEEAQDDVEEFTRNRYERALELGIAKECARFLLPESMQTKLYMTGSLRSWIHYFQLRCSEHAQEEHRELAWKMQYILGYNLPTIANACLWDGP